MQDDMLSDAFEQLLAGQAGPSVVRAIEDGAPTSALWQAIEESGFCDALLPEARGGAGLGLAQAYPLFEACGRHALPVPMAQTTMARALLVDAVHGAPAGSIALATRARPDTAVHVTYGAVADWVLLSDARALQLWNTRAATRQTHEPRSVDAVLQWPAGAKPEFEIVAPHDLRVASALLLAAQMAGAMRRLLETTLQYANERQQFGRSIGKFQALQHQLAVMAEHTEAARMAARIGCTGTAQLPDPLLAAVAKSRTSEAVAPVTSIAHAVHGAIGITEEFDLQLYTRRLHAWRIADGSESYWQQRIGRALLGSGATLPDFARTRLAPAL
jgi:acyl-CoA dehydrogenase